MEEIDIQNIESIFNSPLVNKFYSSFKSISNPEFPEMNYFGINFSKGKISSVKFYFAFFHRLTNNEVAQMLPITADFYKYYKLWDESKIRSLEHTGCTFEVNIKPNKEPTFGFHFRLKPGDESYQLIGLPKLLDINLLEFNARPGINFEYCGDDVLIKKYYYFSSEDSKKYFADRFKLPYIEKIHLVEYTESDSLSKANLWRFDYTEENNNRSNRFSKKELSIIELFREKYNLYNISEGYYENDDTVATYFFNTIRNDGYTPFDFSENFQIDTLKLFV
jgi:hypothetical protein